MKPLPLAALALPLLAAACTSPNGRMRHIAVTEQLDDKAVDWMEKISDAQYGAPATRQPATAATPARPGVTFTARWLPRCIDNSEAVAIEPAIGRTPANAPLPPFRLPRQARACGAARRQGRAGASRGAAGL